MNDMSMVITPKSDQMNADDLIAGPRTVRVARVDIRPGTEQPVTIHYDGDCGKPYKPCKSMCRIMVAAWGADAKTYAGRSMTLYRDPAVKWGGMEVGGIRISHMSHLDKSMLMALTATEGSRKPYTVKPLTDSDWARGDSSPLPPKPAATSPSAAGALSEALLDAARSAALEGMAAYGAWFKTLDRATMDSLAADPAHTANKAAAQAADERAAADQFPGDRP